MERNEGWFETCIALYMLSVTIYMYREKYIVYPYMFMYLFTCWSQEFYKLPTTLLTRPHTWVQTEGKHKSAVHSSLKLQIHSHMIPAWLTCGWRWLRGSSIAVMIQSGLISAKRPLIIHPLQRRGSHCEPHVVNCCKLERSGGKQKVCVKPHCPLRYHTCWKRLAFCRLKSARLWPAVDTAE